MDILPNEAAMKYRRFCHVLPLIILAISQSVRADCMRDSVDSLAVQWSTLIVQAKLVKTGQPIQIPAADGAKPASRPMQGYQYKIDEFEITQVLDGKAKPADHIKIVIFAPPGKMEDSICGDDVTPDLIGKSYVLLLRPESHMHWSGTAGAADPRPAELHDQKTWCVVHLDYADDLGTDGIDSIKNTISQTRSSESQFKQDEAKTQAHTLATAADDTEAGDAGHALVEMGVKAIPAIQAEILTADDEAKQRLSAVVKQLSPPPIVVDGK
jgi:hypothetical protein